MKLGIFRKGISIAVIAITENHEFVKKSIYYHGINHRFERFDNPRDIDEYVKTEGLNVDYTNVEGDLEKLTSPDFEIAEMYFKLLVKEYLNMEL